MRIMIDARMLLDRPTGIGCYIDNLIRQLPNIDGKNDYVILTNNASRIAAKGIKNITVKEISTKPLSFREQLYLPSIIIKEGINVYHSPSFVIPPWIHCKYIMTIHDLTHVLFPEEFSRKVQLYYAFRVKSAARRAALILTDSENSKRDICKWTGRNEDSIRVIPLATEEKFKVIDDKDLELKVKLRWNANNIFILYNGSKKPHKNVGALIEALRLLQSRKKLNFQLVIVGMRDDSQAETTFTELDQKIKAYNLDKYVTFTGKVTDEELIRLYNAATALVLPSLYEGFGLPALEAMACGCPIVVSNASSLPEICGDSAYYIDPLKIDSIADGISTVVNDEIVRRDLRQKGLQRVKMFSWAKCAQETVRAYEEVYVA